MSFFPLEKSLEITPETRPLTQTGTIQVFLQLVEQTLFVQGFEPHEYQDRPPTLLRGCLILRVLKNSKIKNISLNFKGVSKTEWPEGIPPKRTEYFEENDLLNHTWPFFNINTSTTCSSGADIVRLNDHNGGSSNSLDDITNALDSSSIKSGGSNALSIIKRATSPSPSGNRHRSSSLLASLKSSATGNSTDSNILHNLQHQQTNNNGEFTFAPGDYIYNFEQAIPSSTPETIDATFGSVSYSLSVLIERSGAFKSNISTTLPIKIIRAQSEESVEDSEPIAISRDWEDQLHYDIVIATKAIILNAYLPIAFKLVPLDKIKLHRIRIYLTENLEYYCRNKKVHRMEPIKKYLLLEHKAPPPPDLPPNADAKAKKMGNLLTSDGYDITAKEFEFQVYVPQKLNNRQNLHPNTSYINIKSHHWIKICLRLSRLIDGKPKHYEISIDSPIHVLDPLCSHANTLLPAYGDPNSSSTTSDGLTQIHDSNIYFPREVLSPPNSPDVEPVDYNNSSYQNIYNTLNPNGTPPHRGSGGSGDGSSRRGSVATLGVNDGNNNRARSRSVSTLGNRSLPNFESTLNANVYKPDSLELELTSPQAQPATSPSFSPQQRPIHLIRRPSFEPPPFEADISPPPMRDLLTEGIQGLDSAVLDSAPKDPPTYDDFLIEEKAKSPAPPTLSERGGPKDTTIKFDKDSNTPIKSPSNVKTGNATAQPPHLTFTNSTPSPPLVANNPDDDDDDDERTPRQLKKNSEDDDEGDIATNFKFRGTSPNMPQSVIRNTSPEGLRIRSSARSNRDTSPRNSFDSSSTGTLHHGHSNSQQNGIDSLISPKEDESEINPNISNSRNGSTSSTGISDYKSASSTSMSPTSLRSLRIDTENEIVDLQPLLHTTTTNISLNQQQSQQQSSTSSFRPYPPAKAPSVYDPLQSRESLNLINESSSVDITALYSSNEPDNIWHPLKNDSIPKRSYTPNAINTNEIINNFKENSNHIHQPSLNRNMSFGVQQTTIAPILSALDTTNDSQSNNPRTLPNSATRSSIEETNSQSEESSLKNNTSSSTLTSANLNEELINKQINNHEHRLDFDDNDNEQVSSS
ncbi:hypothetical protein BN7_1617 [Wickerhamomyces ciferrii]|uniref:Arrestin C-terminal-like domain-containing protein n=1 Tax=Wickerhamomyces ciferrii (strain ATCC 14091 / BCRC 22168 / CBS 111 / JCM 3599 / NBRC 0793 / NRRL Y-1031 F-60-10) TaxID=1206466 RepID=K0KLS4_WICCF|nr:uncharacterized protein BN7_1617 [Wickerhamomyces ciferrii]CCH42078.1 hypothetical protein BN7_1617 [Wickerhamomyces ciferrii]